MPDRVAGTSQMIRVPHGDCANAVGPRSRRSAAKTDQVYRDLGRAKAIASAKAQTRERPVAGAQPLLDIISGFAFELAEHAK